MQIWAVSTQLLCGVAMGALGFLLVLKTKKHLPLQSHPIGLLLGGILALGSSWYILFWFLSLTIGRTLSPWDQWAGFAPPAGTWQRQLNDFFGQNLNQHWLALAVVGISGALFLRAILRTTKDMRIRIPLAFALTNMAFLLVAFLAIIPAGRLPDLWLPQPRPPTDVGYHRTWPDLLIQGILLGLLFWTQHRIGALSSWERPMAQS